MSMAACFALSWKLLIYALETLFVASDKTPLMILSPAYKEGAISLPARVRLPLRVKLVFKAPVPA